MIRLLITAAILVCGQSAATAEIEAETRMISLRHLWTGERLDTVYRTGDRYDPEGLARINWFMRDWRCDKVTEMDPGLIDLLWELTQELRPKGPIRVISGYRSRGLNLAMKRQGRNVAIRSEHSSGRAVDVVFPGVKAEKVRKAAEARKAGGVGYYPHSGPPFVHLDTGRILLWAQDEPDGKKRAAATRENKPLDCSDSYQKG